MELETLTTEDVTLLTTELSMAVAEMPDQEGPFPLSGVSTLTKAGPIMWKKNPVTLAVTQPPAELYS